MTSRQLSPSCAVNRNHSPASLSLHISSSKFSSFFGSLVAACWRLIRDNNESQDPTGKKSFLTPIKILPWVQVEVLTSIYQPVIIKTRLLNFILIYMNILHKYVKTYYNMCWDVSIIIIKFYFSIVSLSLKIHIFNVLVNFNAFVFLSDFFHF